MRMVVQRVSRASVEVDGATTGSIDAGLLILLGVGRGDGEPDAVYLAEKTLALRVFPDERNRMNRNVSETGGSLLVVPQFTLYGDVRKGNRPSFDEAAPPELANALYQHYCGVARAGGVRVETGVFQAHMRVELLNDGPVTILCSSERTF